MEPSDPSSEEEIPSRLGLGGSTFSARSNAALRSLSPSSSDSELSSASEDIQPHKSGLPSAFGGAKARVRKRQRAQPRRSDAPPPEQRDADPGQWERHTRGIGSKILAKHGFTGRLGKRADGIAAPIKPVYRPEKLGLGAGGFREKEDVVQREEAIEKMNKKTWHHKRKRGEKYPFPPEISFGKAIDVPEALPYEEPIVQAFVQSDQNASSNDKKRIEDRLFATPEVLHNLQMLQDNMRAEASRARRQRDTEMLIIQTAKREVDKASLERQEAKKHLGLVSEAEAVVRKISQVREAGDPNTFGNCVKKLVDVYNRASGESFGGTQVFLATLTEYVSGYVEKQMQDILRQGGEEGKVDRTQVKNVYKLLAEARKALDTVGYIKLCTRAILMPLRRHVSRPSWDIVRGACVGDALSWMQGILPEAIMQIFAEEVLVPRLLSRLRTHHASSLFQTGTEVPPHAWIHPWLPATGRRPLVEVLHFVRITLSKSLQEWKQGDSAESRTALISVVKSWSGVLSRRKVQLALSRHIIPKLGTCLTRAANSYTEEQTVRRTLEEIRDWSNVGSVRLLANHLAKPFLAGPGLLVQKAAFANDNWVKAKDIYVFWTQSLPKRLKFFMQPTLAALLFVLHAARVTTDPIAKRRLQKAKLSTLLQNTFETRRPLEGKKDVKKRDDVVRRGETRKARLADVLEMVGKREGLVVVGLGEERGMRVFQVGATRVVIDVERNVFVVRGRVADVDEVIRLAKGG